MALCEDGGEENEEEGENDTMGLGSCNENMTDVSSSTVVSLLPMPQTFTTYMHTPALLFYVTHDSPNTRGGKEEEGT